MPQTPRRPFSSLRAFQTVPLLAESGRQGRVGTRDGGFTQWAKDELPVEYNTAM